MRTNVRPHASESRVAVPSPLGDAAVNTRRTTTYADALALVEGTYRLAMEADEEPLVSLRRAFSGRDAVFVASGGAIAAAQLAADLHLRTFRRLARAVTPLEYAGMPTGTDVAVLLLSASGRHPDVALAAAAARRAGHRPRGLLTFQQPEKLPTRLHAADLRIVSFPEFGAHEGFLATNSLLAQAVLLTRAYGQEAAAGSSVVQQELCSEPLRPRCLVLTGPGLSCVSSDVETRLHELGTTAVQVTDYRNFGHGRHTGLNRRLEETSVVALIEPGIARLASATLRCLPASAHVIRLESELPWPASALSLLVNSMHLAGKAASDAGINASHPRVPQFGRRLYHLSARYLVPEPKLGPIDRKLMHAGMALDDGAMNTTYQRGLSRFLSSLRKQRFAGLVLDYDGTCCTTAGRFQLPSSAVQQQLTRLLAEGLFLGFASGRGGSLHRDLQGWIPQTLWPSVIVGLYNGGLILNLADEMEDTANSVGVLREVEQRLRTDGIAQQLALSPRKYQLGVQVQADIDPVALARIIREIVETPPALPVRVTASAHSVDVVPPESSKVFVLDKVAAIAQGPVLAIGDQGQSGGNDFELLAKTTLSLTVDQCSSDPTRCWNLDRWGIRGPDLLIRYLRSLDRREQRFRFGWRL